MTIFHGTIAIIAIVVVLRWYSWHRTNYVYGPKCDKDWEHCNKRRHGDAENTESHEE